MNRVKKLLTIGLAVLLMLCSIILSGCSDKKYQVSQEEYEAALTMDALSNVTISMTGPYWERDHKKEYFYSVGKNYALCKYSEDVQYYGRHYGFANGEEFCYLYGSDNLEDFTEEQAVWTKADNPSYYKGKGVNTFLPYVEQFHLLEYDKKTKSYQYENTAYGDKIVYTYYFTDKKLTKYEILNEVYNSHYILEFYNYGATKIPEGIDKSTPEEPSLPLTCIIENIDDYDKGEEVYQNYFTSCEYYVVDTYDAFVSFYTDVIGTVGLPFDEDEFEDAVIFCYYRVISGSLNFVPIEYSYFYATNEIVGKRPINRLKT